MSSNHRMDKCEGAPAPPTKKALKKARAKARKKPKQRSQVTDDMFFAIANGDLEKLREALDAGARPTELDSRGRSTLHFALDQVPEHPGPPPLPPPRSFQQSPISSYRQSRCDHYFVDECNEDCYNSDNDSWDGDWWEDVDTLELNTFALSSIARGSIIKERNNQFQVTVDIVELLLERGADPNIKTRNGRTVLYRVIQIVDGMENDQLTSKFLALIFSYGVNWTYGGNKSKFDPFLLALKNENDEALQLFIEHGYQLDKCQIHVGPSHMWLFFLRMKTFELLVRAGLINVTASDDFGVTALRTTFETEALEDDRVVPLNPVPLDTVKALLELGVQVNAPNVAPNAAKVGVMHKAAVKNNDNTAYSELIRLLVTYGGNLFKIHGKEATPMAFVLREGDLDLIQWCIDHVLERGITMNKLNSIGPLSQAILNKNEGILLYLLRRGFIIDKIDPISKVTALHTAVLTDCRVGHAKLLLEWGANVDSVNGLAETPLHFSCREGSEKCTETLLLHGADINRKTHSNQLALNLALSSKQNRTKIVKCIIRQIVMEESQNRLVDEQNKRLIKKDNSNYYSRCHAEISRAQSSYFAGTKTHYDLLMDPSLKKFVRSEDLYTALLNEGLPEKFPIYGKKMRDRLIKAHEEFLFDEKVRKVLELILGFDRDSCKLIYDRILHYLARTDLYNLANN